MDRQELLDRITEDNVIDILEDLGSPVYSRGTTSSGVQYLTFKTVCHHGDSSKLYYYIDSKNFYCYTNCGALSLFDVVKRAKGYKQEEFGQIVKYIANKANIDLYANHNAIPDSAESKEIRQDIISMQKILEDRINPIYSNGQINTFYNEKILNYFDANTFYSGWMDEGISIASMQKYGIRYYWSENHIIIPHLDPEGRLVGIRRRSLKPEDVNNKYMPEILEGKLYEHPLGLNLYGLYQNKKAIQTFRRAVIVEGEKSVLLSDTYYGDNSIAVATCGFNITNWQIEALLKLGVNTIYLGFDKDYDYLKQYEYQNNKNIYEGYKRYIQRTQKLAQKLSSYFNNVAILEDKKGLLQLKDSPFDRGKDTYEKILNNAKFLDMA